MVKVIQCLTCNSNVLPACEVINFYGEDVIYIKVYSISEKGDKTRSIHTLCGFSTYEKPQFCVIG